jgi:hypothetical protein
MPSDEELNKEITAQEKLHQIIRRKSQTDRQRDRRIVKRLTRKLAIQKEIAEQRKDENGRKETE